MTDFDSFINNHFLRQNLACLIFVVVLANLIIGGVILPYQQLQRAQAAWATFVNQLLQYIGDIINYIWEGVLAVYANAQHAITAASELWQKMEIINNKALAAAWNILRKMLLNMLVNDIVTWIQGGGKPRFVTDWQGFLKNAGDKAAGILIDKMGMGFLCDKFSFQLRLALSSPPEFSESATCTLSAAIANINNFMTDFSKGGWKGWVKLSESKNNYMGAYFKALDEKYAVMSAAAEAAKNEAVSSAGFLGDKVCRKISMVASNGELEEISGTWKQGELPSGAGCLNWEVRTPGRIAADALSQAVTIDIPWLISADEWQQYAGAIIDAVINRVVREGAAAMTSSSAGTSAGYGVSGAPVIPGVNAPAYVSVNLSSYDGAVEESAEALTLTGQLSLLEENLDKVKVEHQTNLGILNNIRTSQNNSLNLLKDFLNNTCSLPSGVSVNTIAGTVQILSTCSGFVCPCIATTVERVRLSAPGTGEAILEKTTTQRYAMTTGFSGFSSCEMTQTISYTTLSTTAAIQGQITAREAEIASLQDQIAKTMIANDDTEEYERLAIIYMNTYESWQNGSSTAATSTAETAMLDAKEMAITSNQIALSSTSTRFNNFANETMEKSNDTGQRIGDLMTERGGIADCQYVQPGLYANLCAAQATTASYQTSLNTCLAMTSTSGGP